MKKFKFELEKLLTYRNQILDSEMMALAALNARLSEVQRQIDDIQEKREIAKAEYEEKIKEKFTPLTCQIYNAYEEEMKKQRKLKLEERQGIIKEIEDQIEVIRQARIDTKSLETIKESRWQEYRKEDIKNEERLLDEFLTAVKAVNKEI